MHTQAHRRSHAEQHAERQARRCTGQQSLVRKPNGFTLLELIVVIAIIVVLAMLAWPSYERFVQRARRADARDLLYALAQAQERWYSNHAVYASDFPTLGVTNDASPNGHYRAAMTLDVAGGFTLTAIPQGAQSSDACGNFTLDDLGVRGVQGGSATVTDCW